MRFMTHDPTSPWKPRGDRLQECLDRITAAAKMDGLAYGASSKVRPYSFYQKQVAGSAAKVIVEFEHEDDEHLRYSVRIEEYAITPQGEELTGRLLAGGPTGLVNVHDGLDAAAGDIDAAFDKIIAYLESSALKVIKRADPDRPPGLSDLIAEIRRFITS